MLVPRSNILHLEEPGPWYPGFTTIKAQADRNLLRLDLCSLLGNACRAVGRGGSILCTFYMETNLFRRRCVTK